REQQLLDEAHTLTGFDPVAIHGDVLPEHLRCRDGRLVGVIDWGDPRIGDPALDYAWPPHGPVPPAPPRRRAGRLVGVIDWGDARIGDPALDYAWLLNGPFPHWDVDDDLRRRGGFYHRLHPRGWGPHG